MTQDALDTLRPGDRGRARAALDALFGGRSVSTLTPLPGGISAGNYRFEVTGRAYVLRLEGPRGGLRNPLRSYPCMAAAAQAGIAPALHHADAAAGVAIMDFHEPRPLTAYPGGVAALAGDLGRLVARLQTTPGFPDLTDFATIVGRTLGFIRGSGLFAPGLLDPHATAFERLTLAYPWDMASRVASHNDPNPRNLIFDGTRLWLIDWETSFRNDPFVDIAILTDETATTPEAEAALLAGWLDRRPTRFDLDRLVLMKPIIRLYYAGLLFGGFAAHPPQSPDADLSAPSAEQFVAALASGDLKPGTPQLAYTFGKMHLAGFLAAMAAPETRAALSAFDGRAG